jgi:hypothetical protein
LQQNRLIGSQFPGPGKVVALTGRPDAAICFFEGCDLEYLLFESAGGN